MFLHPVRLVQTIQVPRLTSPVDQEAVKVSEWGAICNHTLVKYGELMDKPWGMVLKALKKFLAWQFWPFESSSMRNKNPSSQVKQFSRGHICPIWALARVLSSGVKNRT